MMPKSTWKNNRQNHREREVSYSGGASISTGARRIGSTTTPTGTLTKPHSPPSSGSASKPSSSTDSCVGNKLIWNATKSGSSYARQKKKLVVPIALPLREHLLSLSVPDQLHAPVHPQAYAIVTSQHGRVGTLSNAFADLLAQAGLRSPRTSASTGRGRDNARSGVDLSFHSLRHTAVSLQKNWRT
jgi:hypothetical protein